MRESDQLIHLLDLVDDVGSMWDCGGVVGDWNGHWDGLQFGVMVPGALQDEFRAVPD
jgi:hypothetical protein